MTLPLPLIINPHNDETIRAVFLAQIVLSSPNVPLRKNSTRTVSNVSIEWSFGTWQFVYVPIACLP